MWVEVDRGMEENEKKERKKTKKAISDMVKKRDFLSSVRWKRDKIK